jgi:cytochrome c oxidase assembly factor CtaG
VDGWWWKWSANPLQLAPLVMFGVAYFARVRTLARRGAPVPAWRRLSFTLGLVLSFLAVASPIDWLGENRLLSVHMVQHLLLGDLAPLALVLGVTGPVLRPLLAIHSFQRLRVLLLPQVALPVWAVNLCVWHLPVFYEAALHHSAVHALQHILFFTCGLLMWGAVVEVLPGPAWFGTGAKLGYMVVVRAVETVLGNVIFWAGGVFYPTYDAAPRMWGLSALADQGIAGGIMMIEGSIVTICALSWLFLKLAAEGEMRQELLERGIDPRAVDRAVRYGRGRELSPTLDKG